MRMRRAFALIVVACLCAPAAAGAKGGVIFDEYPDVQSVDSPIEFTVMLNIPEPIEGVRPLITFRNTATGEVVRVRASRSDLNGLAHGTAEFPSSGPWETAVTVNGREVLPPDAEPFRVGVGLTQTISSANAEEAHAASADARGGPDSGNGPSAWLWITAAATIGSALLVLVMRHRRRWGAA